MRSSCCSNHFLWYTRGSCAVVSQLGPVHKTELLKVRGSVNEYSMKRIIFIVTETDILDKKNQYHKKTWRLLAPMAQISSFQHL